MERRKIKKRLRERVFSEFQGFHPGQLNKEEIEAIISRIFRGRKRKEEISEEENSIVGEIVNDLLGWGPLQPFMEDDAVTEILVNGPEQVFIEKDGKETLSEVKFDDEHHLRYIIERMIRPTGRRVDESYPYVDFSLEDGSRVNVVIPPISAGGASLTIRKFSRSIDKIDDLVRLGTLNGKMGEFLLGCIKARLSIIFSGATGAGKTTTLGVLSNYINPEERIIAIEDTLELHLNQKDLVRLLTRPPNIEGRGEITIRSLFINTLRMRPSRIILGEIRGAEAIDYLQALNSGHRGCLAVIHASSPKQVVSRLETMVFFYSGAYLPVWAIRRQISQGLDLVIQHEQMTDGSRKITNISEIGEMDDENNVIIRDLFCYQQRDLNSVTGEVTGEFKTMGVVPKFLDRFKKSGVEISEDFFRG